MYHVRDGELQGEVYKKTEDRNLEKENLKRHLVEHTRCRATGTIPLPKVKSVIIVDTRHDIDGRKWTRQHHLVGRIPPPLPDQTQLPLGFP